MAAVSFKNGGQPAQVCSICLLQQALSQPSDLRQKLLKAINLHTGISPRRSHSFRDLERQLRALQGQREAGHMGTEVVIATEMARASSAGAACPACCTASNACPRLLTWPSFSSAACRAAASSSSSAATRPCAAKRCCTCCAASLTSAAMSWRRRAMSASRASSCACKAKHGKAQTGQE